MADVAQWWRLRRTDQDSADDRRRFPGLDLREVLHPHLSAPGLSIVFLLCGRCADERKRPTAPSGAVAHSHFLEDGLPQFGSGGFAALVRRAIFSARILARASGGNPARPRVSAPNGVVTVSSLMFPPEIS